MVVIYRVRGRPQDDPRNWVTAAGRWDVNQAKGTKGSSRSDRYGVHTGNINFSQDHYHPLSHIP